MMNRNSPLDRIQVFCLEVLGKRYFERFEHRHVVRDRFCSNTQAIQGGYKAMYPVTLDPGSLVLETRLIPYKSHLHQGLQPDEWYSYLQLSNNVSG